MPCLNDKQTWRMCWQTLTIGETPDRPSFDVSQVAWVTGNYFGCMMWSTKFVVAVNISTEVSDQDDDDCP